MLSRSDELNDQKPDPPPVLQPSRRARRSVTQHRAQRRPRRQRVPAQHRKVKLDELWASRVRRVLSKRFKLHLVKDMMGYGLEFAGIIWAASFMVWAL